MEKNRLEKMERNRLPQLELRCRQNGRRELERPKNDGESKDILKFGLTGLNDMKKTKKFILDLSY